MSQHEKYMHFCLDLAVKGLGRVAPNPMVGCVIVGENGTIGEGYHEIFGGPHAEINAINSLDGYSDIKNATLYVNLEPCAHQGKTGPCADAIIAKGIKKVVVGCLDPNPLVNGKGVEKLIRGGVDVITGILERESMEVNKRYFTYHKKKRPHVILKWAQSSDGFIDKKRTSPDQERAKITEGEADMMVHLWRSQEQAIMVGTHTVIMDNPSLTTRKVEGRSPVRIVLDRTLRIPTSSKVFDTAVAKTIVFTEQKNNGNHGAEYIPINFDANLLPNLLKKLYDKEIQSVIVEGGEKLLKSFVEKDLWDEAKVFFSAKKFGEGVSAPGFPFPTTGEIRIGDDTLAFYRNKHNN
jgi:diaminohydroxyphosphoribosylaminopyrimidine deaminase/5-amino-6-(5-phosphoribosylamino)uracil reductase